MDKRRAQDATQRGDEVAYAMRNYYEANRPLRWWEKRNPPDRWGEIADNLMIGLANIALNAEMEYRAQQRPADTLAPPRKDKDEVIDHEQDSDREKQRMHLVRSQSSVRES